MNCFNLLLFILYFITFYVSCDGVEPFQDDIKIIYDLNKTFLANFSWENVDIGVKTFDNSDVDPLQNLNDVVRVSSVDAGKNIFLHYIQNFISSEEAKTLINICDGRDGWKNSPVRADVIQLESSNTGDISSMDKDNKRTSSSCPLLWPRLYQALENNPLVFGDLSSTTILDEFKIANKISKRVSKFLEVDVDQIEPLQIVRYKFGEYYQTHHDHGGYYGFSSEQRSYTLLLFLNSVPLADGGGHTHFPKVGLKVLPKIGDAILWANVNFEDGSILTDAIHEAMSIQSESTVKYVCNVWVSDAPNELKNMNSPFITT